jgi:MarR family transcriptional regulator, organic hydroperoxide resistance regulator
MESDPSVGLLLVQICRAHRTYVNTALHEINLHVGQEHMVWQLARQEGMSQAELAQALSIDASTTTKMLARLERDGVVERQAHPEDARALLVYLTPHGQALVQSIDAIWQRAESILLQGLTETEQTLLRRLLLQMHENFT